MYGMSSKEKSWKMKLQVLFSFRINFLRWIAGFSLLVLHGCATLPEEALDRRASAQADDKVIESRAAMRLRNEIGNGNRLTATSYNRHVLLTGEVSDGSARSRIAEAIMDIESVQGVWNEITIADNNSIAAQTNDSLVASKVRARLDKAIPLVASHVRVVVDAGTVFLLGIVTAQEAQEVVQIARTTDEARYVVNVMQVVSGAEIQRIEAALRPPPITTDCNCTVPAPRTTGSAPTTRETW
jgi:osmotically-inducible protein OsmY